MAAPESSLGVIRTVEAQALRRTVPLHRRFRPEGVGSPTRNRWPAGLIGMLALVAMVEASVARRWMVVTEPVAFSWRFSTSAAAEKAPGCRVLCVGDSLAKHGLVSSVIEAGTGRRTYNLAAAAAPAPLTYFVLKRAIDAGARPDAVVLDFKPNLLAGGPRYGLRGWSEVLSAGEALDLALAARSRSFIAELLVGMTLPTFRARHDLRDNLLAALRGETARLRELIAICRRNWTVNLGTNVATPRPAFTGRVSEEQHRALLSSRFVLHKVNARYVRRTLDLAAAKGVRVYLLIAPFAPESLQRQRQTGCEEAYSHYVRSLQDDYPTLTVLDARRSCYGANVFIDPSHLDRRGALTLSLDVAAAVREGLASPSGGPRWVALPRYRAVPEPPAMEDVEQSRERLGIAWRP